ncbi:DUF1214 domain-containing protein [Microbacterium sp. KUDC0406]|uniref:DUF1214 domain-containing protein n=1 Tax=Microbacterium sp. KUDC0406 TaxID=2909588 RepID=UPI001F1E6B21|nr:DUF1214 domain-containing protein [Microbacterium sp. KUDC0406]UJP09089.1 DUF1214 domain-containing protein [Microbacterium sp. KUDC0406]
MTEQTYAFLAGFPTPETIDAAYDASDLVRAIAVYKHFFPAVSGYALFDGNLAIGVVPNRVFGTMDTRPDQRGLTLNSDTPYASVILDLSDGALVVDLPAGPILGALLNADQSWIADVGIPGPDNGEGGRFVILPPGASADDVAAQSELERTFFVRATTPTVIAGLRAVPVDADVDAAIALMKRTVVTPLDSRAPWEQPRWIDLTGTRQDTSPNRVQGTAAYWDTLLRYITEQGTTPADQTALAELAVLGIRAGEPMPADERTVSILKHAAVEADAQMRVQSLADRRQDRVAWPDRHWEWVSLRPENASFDLDGHLDVTARETWFYQAIASSPAMFRRQAGGGSVYWFCARDSANAYLDGGSAYTLTVPLPVPAKLFWSITVYDAQTRSQIATQQGNAALRSMFELRSHLDADEVTLHFGPTPPEHADHRWVQTIPGSGWFVYFRIYGPSEGAFDGNWRPGDFIRQPHGERTA